MKCFNPTLRSQLNAELKLQKEAADREFKANDDKGPWHEMLADIKMVERELDKIGYAFEVGDGCHTGGNGDRYPYRVVEVSPSGKTIKCVAMDYRAAKKGLPMGHQDWEVSDGPADRQVSMVATFRKNGRWVQKGMPMNAGYGGVGAGAVYSYNWEY